MDVIRRFGATRDWIVAAVLAATFLGEVALLGLPSDNPTPLAEQLGPGALVAAGLLLIATLAIRRRAPLLLLVPAVAWLMLAGGPLEGWSVPVVGIALVAYTLGSTTRESAALLASVGVGALIVIGVVAHPDGPGDPGDVVLTTLVLAGPWATGLAMRVRGDRERALLDATIELERTRERETRAAVTEERARIGRELHDEVAHAMSVVVLQARGARQALTADPAAAREAIDAIETTATAALADTRRLLGAFRANDDAAELAPRPGLRDLDALVGQVRDAGLPVDLAVQGAAVNLAAGVDVSAYRILQEALTNALRHAGPATARVVVRYEPGFLDLEVIDSGSPRAVPGAGPGRGIAGMRERAALLGGTFDAGPRPGGGFRVRARLPTGEAAT